MNAGLNGPGPTVALEGIQETGEAVITLGSDAPLQIFRRGSRIDKGTLERIHLEKFRFDSLLRSGEVPFEDVRQGSDPPDFAVLVDGETNHLDCAALALQSRRTAYQLFRSLRNEIMQCANSVDFGSVGGCVLHITFGEGADLPPRRGDKQALKKIVQSIAEFPDRRQEIANLTNSIVAQGGMPERLPLDMLTGQAPDNLASFSVNLFPDGSLTGAFYDATGFECALGMSFEVTHESTFAELSRVISQHDQESIDHLLITVGGPDREGYVYPGEEFLHRFAREYRPTCIHLRRVTLHSFMTGEITDLVIDRFTATS
ncbi:hypothetical protein ACFW2I_21130 [Streptomyces nigra]|uniref:hypothetical protein n=1 Tax=Streptomyces nigra TaxID=1827580 RepID=UPI0036B4A52E